MITGLGEGEIESLALVLARGLEYCAGEPVVREALRRLGVSGRWVPLATLLAGLGSKVEIPESVPARGPGKEGG